MIPPKASRRAVRAHEVTVPTDNRAVVLTRGSTEEQVLTLEVQRDNIRRYCDFKGVTIAREFEDRGTCGKAVFLDRPIVREMLAFMQSEGIRTIICTRLDRAFRSQGDSIITLDTLYRHGVLIHFCEQNIDPTTPTGRAMFQMLGTFAELETNIRQQRQLEAFDQQRKLGQKSGVNVPYGWMAVDSPGRLTRERRQASDLVPHPEQQQILGEILRRHAEGQSDIMIAATLNAAGIKTAKAGQKMKYRGREIVVKGDWSAQTVFSVRSFARLADERLTSENPDDVEDAVTELSMKHGHKAA